jgi:hypothetical protein
MRWKIVLVNGGIVVVLTLLVFVLLRASLQGVVENPAERRRELARGLHAASARFTLDDLLIERWLDRQTALPDVEAVFAAGTARARSEAATDVANRLRDAGVASPEFTKIPPSLVAFVDADGVVLGRNGSELMRGDRVGAVYPGLMAALASAQTGSEFWVNPARQEQMLVSYAPVRKPEGGVVGALVIGTPLNDDRLERVSELTHGGSLALVVGSRPAPLAAAALDRAAFGDAAVASSIASARKGGMAFARAPVGASIYGALAVEGLGTPAVIVAAIPTSRVASIDSLLWPVLAVGGLGLLLVFVAGTMLGNYISRPVAEIEDGLLSIMNGRRDLRFDLEHDELGGLTSRLNQLLNTLLGVSDAAPDESAPPAGDPPPE